MPTQLLSLAFATASNPSAPVRTAQAGPSPILKAKAEFNLRRAQDPAVRHDRRLPRADAAPARFARPVSPHTLLRAAACAAT